MAAREVIAFAETVMSGADRWLVTPNVELGGATPAGLLVSREGCDRVYALLLAIAEGVTA